MTAYPPKAMAVVCILMETETKTYRKTVGYLRMHPDLVSRIGLSKIPSKSIVIRLKIRKTGPINLDRWPLLVLRACVHVCPQSMPSRPLPSVSAGTDRGWV